VGLSEGLAGSRRHHALGRPHQHFAITGVGVGGFLAQLDGAAIGFQRLLPVVQHRFGAGVEHPALDVAGLGTQFLFQAHGGRLHVLVRRIGRGRGSGGRRRNAGGDLLLGQHRSAQAPVEPAAKPCDAERQHRGEAPAVA
jgi:hypothetical protein